MSISLHISMDTSKITALLESKIKKMADFSQSMEAVGMYLQKETDKHFKEAKEPDGSNWAPLADLTMFNRREGPGKGGPTPLQDTGILKNSISVCRVDAFSVQVGTNVPYAKYQQFGTKGPYTIKPKDKKALKFNSPAGWIIRREVIHPGIPARPFLGINQDNIEHCKRIVGGQIVGR